MIRSFAYAAYSTLFDHATVNASDVPLIESWVGVWQHSVAGMFLHAYLDTVDGAPFIPDNREELGVLLDAFLLEKAVYELAYELNNRPGWALIPLRGLIDILKTGHASAHDISDTSEGSR